MIRKKVCFITPCNDVFTLNYSDVENFCKNICLSNEHINDFNEFKNDYSYFTPYFDYVMFKLDYIFVNSMFSERFGLFNFDNALYLYPISSFDYKRCYSEIKDIHEMYCHMPFITSVSDSELGICKSSFIDTGDNMLDPNLYNMMSRTGTIEGSHEVTAKSVLNQLLIKSKLLVNYYYDFIVNDGIDLSVDPINFLVGNLGFLRATSVDLEPMIIGNMAILSEEQKKFIGNSLDYGYQFYDINNEKDKNYIKIYKEILKEDN